MNLQQRIHSRDPLLLDGATGTELERRGQSLAPPAWSAAALVECPQVLRQIHADYVSAGAEVITANTFRTHRRNLRAAGWQDRADELTAAAIELARQAAGERAFVVGSLAPLGDCYSPEQTPSPQQLLEEHAEQATQMVACGVDGILVETQVSIAESTAAVSAAKACCEVVLVSWVLNPQGQLLTGESLRDAIAAVLPLEPTALLVNCLPVATVPIALAVLRESGNGMPFGVYANTGWMNADGTWQDATASDPDVYAAAAVEWQEQGPTLIGGCCGTTPQHIAALRDTVGSRPLKSRGE